MKLDASSYEFFILRSLNRSINYECDLVGGFVMVLYQLTSLAGGLVLETEILKYFKFIFILPV
jgi:hypothetical protein